MDARPFPGSPSGSRLAQFAKLLLPLVFSMLSAEAVTAEDPWVTYEGKAGPGAGKHVVLISGDEEYRSEEALPMLGKILAERHGFRSTVLFAIDPDGTINPDNQGNIPGLEALAEADLMVIFTRFRELPDEQMKHIVDYVESGRPIVGLRTATHAFFYRQNKTSPYAHYSFDSKEWPGGFGQQILGDTWVNHHGHHKVESTRGVIRRERANHPILRGVDELWGPTDVYGLAHLPADADVLVDGQVLAGMEPDDPPVQGEKNDPMVPVVWTRELPTPGSGKQRVVTTTLGASVDLLDEGLRRLMVNAAYWAVGLEQAIPQRADASLVSPYEPTFFGFGEYRKGLRPSDFR